MSGKMYQVQNGQKVDITPQVATLSTGTRRNVGELVYSLVPLDDAGLHLVDGSLLATTGVYAEGVAAIIALRPNHPYLFTSETMWQQSVNQYGVCGKFVYDAGAGTLRLPKVTGHIAGTLNATALGDLIEAGLPNIKGQLEVGWGSLRGAITNAFTPAPTSVEGFRTLQGENVSGWYNKVMLDASQVSSIYNDNCTTVQPQAIKGFLYMVLANRPKTPIQVDIDNIAADLALKADISLGNVNSTGQAAMAHAAMPSGQYIILTLPASGGTVTAPADGWVFFAKYAGAAGEYIALTNRTGGGFNDQRIASKAGDGLYLIIPASKNNSIEVYYAATGATIDFRFIYCNGSAPTNP